MSTGVLPRIAAWVPAPVEAVIQPPSAGFAD